MKGLTDLQLILIAGGSILILFIIIYNRIRSSRLRKAEIARRLAKKAAETGKMAADSIAEAVVTAETVDTVVAQMVASEKAVIEETLVSVMREFPVDDIIECVITITPEKEVPAEKILPLIQSLQYAGKMPVRFVGLSIDGNGQKNWHAIHSSQSYSQFRACVLMANCQDALTDIEFSSLIAQLNHLTAGIDAEMDVPDMEKVIGQAQQLHEFVSNHDAKIWLSIQLNGQQWNRDQVAAVLEKYQYQLRPDGTWVKNDLDEGAECELFLIGAFSRKDSDTVLSLILFLDVPCIPREKDPFGQMVSCAQELCKELGGILVDEKGNVMTDEYVTTIAEQLEQYYQVMQSASLHAGSLRSLRLYRLQAV
ncbi:MAG: cell division protein ZipA C-terminal FtsZ-binding domain-containing protein [Oxalobacter sp.]